MTRKEVSKKYYILEDMGYEFSSEKRYIFSGRKPTASKLVSYKIVSTIKVSGDISLFKSFLMAHGSNPTRSFLVFQQINKRRKTS